MTLKSKRILITGAHGFLGTHLTKVLKSRGYRKLITPSHRDYDLTSQARLRALFRDTKPQIVIHLAARVGGIQANQKYPGSFFYQNAFMGIALMEEARLSGVQKFVNIGTVCSYPKFTPVPFRESDIWSGYPEETNAPYGLAKKMLLVQSKAYRDQYGFKSIYLIPVNMYGPGDDFEPESSHVIPALIRRFTEARRINSPFIKVWGDGSASREFLYAPDCAEAIRRALERYDSSEPLNIGTGREIRIRSLAELIKKLTVYRGKIVWDRSKPNGQPRRRLDVSLAKKRLGFSARTPLEIGLKRTITWYDQSLSNGVLNGR